MDGYLSGDSAPRQWWHDEAVRELAAADVVLYDGETDGRVRTRKVRLVVGYSPKSGQPVIFVDPPGGKAPARE